MPRLRTQLGRLRRAVIAHVSRESDPLSLIQPAHLQSEMVSSQCHRLLSDTLKMIEIEVFSFCNRRCWYCPNSFIDRRSENIFMDEGVFCKILDNLSEIDYSEKVSFSRYNEPLADRHILTCIQKSRSRLPKATLHLNTNGDYLSHSMLGDLESAGLDSLNIQVYSKDREYSDEQVTKLLFNKIDALGIPHSFRNSQPSTRLEYRLHYKDLRVLIYARNFSKNGTDRGATIPELAKPTHRTSPCLIPFVHMYIDYNGKVVPCCNIRSDHPDHEPFVLGDLSAPNASLFSIFASENAVRMRRNLVGFWEKDPPCESCVFQELPDDDLTRRRIDRVTRKAGISRLT
jgi:MoaA/NifB/PqqE/SkfB family radical SAM enzyme